MFKIILLIIISLCITYNGNGQSNFNLPDIETKVDSVLDNNSNLIEIGNVEQKHKLRFSYWKEFYTSGELKSEGLFLTEKYMDCDNGKVFWKNYSYKTGPWKYYYKNGIVKAQGTYETQLFNYPTACKGGYEIIKQKAGENWEFYNDNEKLAKRDKDYIKEIEEIYFAIEDN